MEELITTLGTGECIRLAAFGIPVWLKSLAEKERWDISNDKEAPEGTYFCHCLKGEVAIDDRIGTLLRPGEAAFLSNLSLVADDFPRNIVWLCLIPVSEFVMGLETVIWNTEDVKKQHMAGSGTESVLLESPFRYCVWELQKGESHRVDKTPAVIFTYQRNGRIVTKTSVSYETDDIEAGDIRIIYAPERSTVVAGTEGLSVVCIQASYIEIDVPA